MSKIFAKAANWVAHATGRPITFIACRLRDTSYQKAGETIYTVDRIADTFGILATRAE